MSLAHHDDTASPARLLLVAPHSVERHGLQRALQGPGRQVLASHDPRSVDDAPRQGAQLLLLDPRVEPARPGRTDAWWRLRRLREQHRRLPVIVLQRGGNATDRSVAYEMGADAVCDPRADARELRAQVDALLRRTCGPLADSHAARPGALADAGGTVHFGAWSLEPATRSLRTATGLRVTLSPAEYRLLRAFLDRPGHALARQALIDLARGTGTEQLDRNVDLLVSRLRHKMADEAGPASPIRTVRGVGYLFEALEG
ncbi:MAG: response regulator transcription factor [Burkholderiaceae bacterium]